MTVRNGQPGAGGTEARQYRGSCRRTERTRRIRTIKGHAAFCESFEIRRFVKPGRSVKSRVTPSQIVRKNEYNILCLLRFRGLREGSETKEKQEHSMDHGIEMEEDTES